MIDLSYSHGQDWSVPSSIGEMMSEQLDDTQESYTPDAGEETGPVFCGVCGDEMTLTAKNSRGPRGWAQAMGMRSRGETDTGSPHDVYDCPNVNEYWHRQVRALREAARKTVSGRQEKAFLDEANTVLKDRVCTKKLSKLYHLGI
jgi:uncharacterized Zn finger protein (UPF0148 family)